MAEATSKLTFALGRDVSGKAFAVDLARMPHLLIAGATGSGKSVCVNALITSFLMRARPDEVKLVLVDLKRVELAQYDGLPHLKTPVIVEAHDARKALGWAVREMEDRYKKLASRAERNITAYNASPRVASGRAPALHRDRDRRAGRPDDARGPQGRGPGRQARPEGPRRRHPPRARHAASVGQRRDGPDQGQRAEPDRLRHVLERGQSHRARPAGRGGPHRPRRHALPARRPAAARSASRASS